MKPSSQSSNKSSLPCECRTKERRLFRTINMGSQVLIQNPLLANRAGKGRRARHSHRPSAMGAFFPSKASMLVLADKPMPMMPALSSQAVGSQTTLPQVNPPTLRITPPWGKGDPPISVTGVLPRPLGKTRAGGNTWQHTCSLESPEFKDALLIARAKKGTECTPEEHTIISCALKHEKAQARAS